MRDNVNISGIVQADRCARIAQADRTYKKDGLI